MAKIEKEHRNIIIGLIVYAIIVLIIFLPGYLRNKHDKVYITYGNDIKIKYENGSWQNIIDDKDINNKYFHVYEGNTKKGVYKLVGFDRISLYNSGGKKEDYSDILFTYNSNIGFEVPDVKKEYVGDNEEAKEVLKEALKEIKITEYDYFDDFTKYSLDIDNDSNIENIYSVSNYYNSDKVKKVFSVIFLENEGKIKILKSNVINKEDVYGANPAYSIIKIIDFRKDGKYEILLSQDYFSQPDDSCVLIYGLYGKNKEIANLCD